MKLYRVTSNTASVAHGKRKNTQGGRGGRELAAGGMRRAKCQSHSQSSSSSSWTGAGAGAGRGNWTAEQARQEQGEWEEPGRARLSGRREDLREKGVEQEQEAGRSGRRKPAKEC